jgi:hypothetical protein
MLCQCVTLRRDVQLNNSLQTIGHIAPETKYIAYVSIVDIMCWPHRMCCVCPQVDGQSHVVHSEEEAMGTRLTIDSLTCLLANEVHKHSWPLDATLHLALSA